MDRGMTVLLRRQICATHMSGSPTKTVSEVLEEIVEKDKELKSKNLKNDYLKDKNRSIGDLKDKNRSIGDLKDKNRSIGDLKDKNRSIGDLNVENRSIGDLKVDNQKKHAGIEMENRRRFSEIYNKARYSSHELTPEEFSEMQQLMLRLQPENHSNKN
jgi:hypothetical protein